MNEYARQLVERLFRGRTDESMDKHELLDKAHAMGLPASLLGYLDTLAPGSVDREDVARHLAEAEGTEVERDVADWLEREAA